MSAFFDTGHSGTWQAVLPYLQFPVIEYPGANPSCCAPEYAPATVPQGSIAGDVVPAGTGFAGRGRVAPHCGATSRGNQ